MTGAVGDSPGIGIQRRKRRATEAKSLRRKTGHWRAARDRTLSHDRVAGAPVRPKTCWPRPVEASAPLAPSFRPYVRPAFHGRRSLTTGSFSDQAIIELRRTRDEEADGQSGPATFGEIDPRRRPSQGNFDCSTGGKGGVRDAIYLPISKKFLTTRKRRSGTVEAPRPASVATRHCPRRTSSKRVA